MSKDNKKHTQHCFDRYGGLPCVCAPSATPDQTPDIKDYRCPNCGASWSVPLGMTCANHHPEALSSVGDSEAKGVDANPPDNKSKALDKIADVVAAYGDYREDYPNGGYVTHKEAMRQIQIHLDTAVAEAVKAANEYAWSVLANAGDVWDKKTPEAVQWRHAAWIVEALAYGDTAQAKVIRERLKQLKEN